MSKKKKKRGRGALFSKEKGCYVLVTQEFISFHMSTDLYLTNTRNKESWMSEQPMTCPRGQPTCGHKYAINLPRPNDQHLPPCLPIPSTVSLSPIPSYHNCKQSPLKLKPLSFHPPRITLKLILGRTRETKPSSLHPHPLVSITTCSLANHPLYPHMWVSKVIELEIV